MRPRLTQLMSMLAISAAALGCSAADPSSPPTGVSSRGPTPTGVTTAPPSSTPDADRSPLAGCLGPRPDLSAILAVDPRQRPVCFGRSELTFLAAGAAVEVDCAPVRVDPAWLWCPPAAFLTPPGTADSSRASVEIESGTRSTPTDGTPVVAAVDVALLEAHVPPGSGLDQALLVQGAILRVTGHFDDPAAATCRIVAAPPGEQVPAPAEVVLGCREAFVVTSVQRGSA